MDYAIPNASLHHVGYITADLPKTVSLFQTCFGYVVESPVFTDPVQTAVVQFLRLPAATSWLEIVAPLASPSKLDAALRRGSTLHHLCFEVEDLAKSSAWLRSTGFTGLGPPAPAVAFAGRRIAWFATGDMFLVELVEAGEPPFSVESLHSFVAFTSHSRANLETI